MKKIVLSQTCQGLVLKQLLLSSDALKKEFECTFIPNYELQNGKPGLAPPAALQEAVKSCNVLIYHDIAHYNFPALVRQMPPGGVAIKIPYITSTIYWPTYEYQNPFWLCPRGTTALIPWPCTVLNELIVSLRDKRKILNAYLETDIASCIDINRVYTSQLAYLRSAESGSIFNISEFVEKNFRDTQLFHLINHPALPVFLELANAIFAHLDMPLLKNFRNDPFATHQVPIHPSIIRRYSLSWCDETTKFQMMDRSFTFSEYVALYIDHYIEKFQYTLFPSLQAQGKHRPGPLKKLSSFFSRRGKKAGL
ncbi:WcbI family polysaccharide biosynthesis putative acetyltransferase [Desulfolutivibrio sp.]|uniref:WcbI family polysaccharide biosynthesis putative acetyltransferase n=1 Tax=Desulfolutivibrio sp. TaxID=2773296 RepID=UPI002F967C5F